MYEPKIALRFWLSWIQLLPVQDVATVVQYDMTQHSWRVAGCVNTRWPTAEWWCAANMGTDKPDRQT